MKFDTTITVKSLAEKLKVTKRTVLRDIEKLKYKGRIKRIGKEKSGYWEILNLEQKDNGKL